MQCDATRTRKDVGKVQRSSELDRMRLGIDEAASVRSLLHLNHIRGISIDVGTSAGTTRRTLFLALVKPSPLVTIRLWCARWPYEPSAPP